MSLEQEKQRFIRFMEEEHGSNPYPRNFFGCLLSIIIEEEPISQERIMELTGYSQATISLALQKIQLLMPLKTLKNAGDRRNYYRYDGPRMQFLFDMFQRRVDVQDIDLGLVNRIAAKVELESSTQSLLRFQNYLNNINFFLSTIHTLRSAGLDPFKRFLKTGSFNTSGLKNHTYLERGPLKNFLVSLRSSSISAVTKNDGNESSSAYMILKKEYLTGLKSSINPLYSQTLANHLIIIHDIFIEGQTTQDRIEESTQLPRSTISERLAIAVQRGQIQARKLEGTKTKIYSPTISFVDMMLGYFDRVSAYERRIRTRLAEIMKSLSELQKSKESTGFCMFVKELDKVYEFADRHTTNMKVEFVLQLKEQFEEGFSFI